MRTSHFRRSGTGEPDIIIIIMIVVVVVDVVALVVVTVVVRVPLIRARDTVSTVAGAFAPSPRGANRLCGRAAGLFTFLHVNYRSLAAFAIFDSF